MHVAKALGIQTTDGTTTTYVWDYANRLIALGVGNATTTYGYDWAGNRVFQTTSSCPGRGRPNAPPINSPPDAPNRAKPSQKSSYQTRGRRRPLTSDEYHDDVHFYPSKFYSVASSTGSGAKFATTTSYVFNSDTLLSTIDQQLASGSATGSAQTRYVHPDHLGSTNVVTNENGALVETLDYYPYGATRISVSTSTNEKRKFIDQFSDDSPQQCVDNACIYFNAVSITEIRCAQRVPHSC
jgi:uncharacterized protein RhaS with RHS repeats